MSKKNTYVVEWGNNIRLPEDALEKYKYILSQQDTLKDWEECDFKDFYCEDVPFLLAYVEFLLKRQKQVG